ncbi:MAG: hypothetical protein AAFY26_26330 [Cyanobacteria bacterium J06638_22]
MAKSFCSTLEDRQKAKKQEDPQRRAMAETLFQESSSLSDKRFRRMQLDIYQLILKYKQEQITEDEAAATSSSDSSPSPASIGRPSHVFAPLAPAAPPMLHPRPAAPPLLRLPPAAPPVVTAPLLQLLPHP